MFCPKCGCEYREGFTECADCHLPLQNEPPEPESQPEYVRFIPIMATYNAVDISLVKGMLGSKGIPHYFEGEMFNIVHPLVRAARLFVPKDRAEEVVEILKDLKLKFFAPGFATSGPSDMEDSPDDSADAEDGE